MSSSRLGARAHVYSSLEPLEPRRLFTAFIVTTVDDSAATIGSLRWAMVSANTTAGADQITFKIPGAGPHLIQPLSQLPVITETVSIDGTTQPGFAGTPIVEINGERAGRGANGLWVGASDCLIRGLVVNGFAANGIRIGVGFMGASITRNVIAGNYVGTDVTGTLAKPNRESGIVLAPRANGNTIGGAFAGDRNVISGNRLDGISLRGLFTGTARGNVIRGNYIGLDATGAAIVANHGRGINAGVLTGATIDDNVISGNDEEGVRIDAALSDTFRLTGNLIGTDATGSFALGNTEGGVFVRGTFDTRIGGPSLKDRNVISGNAHSGVFITGTTIDLEIVNNFIGTDVTGSAAVPNHELGIDARGPDELTIHDNVISANLGGGIRLLSIGALGSLQANRVGTTADGSMPLGNHGPGIQVSGNALGLEIGHSRDPARGNIISANAGPGVQIAATSAISVANNFIGTNRVGAAMGNEFHGVEIDPGNAFVSVGQAGAGNAIAFNGGDGVTVLPGNSLVTISANSIHSNGELGIDLNNDGVTANDFWDMDDGANGLQNYPTITGATINQLTFTASVSGSLRSAPFRRYRVDFYASAAADPSGFGEGERYLGSGLVTTNLLGSASFAFSFGFLSFPGSQITATATLMVPIGGGALGPVATSEFSRAFAATVIPVADPFPFPIGSAPATLADKPDADDATLEDLIATR